MWHIIQSGCCDKWKGSAAYVRGPCDARGEWRRTSPTLQLSLSYNFPSITNSDTVIWMSLRQGQRCVMKWLNLSSSSDLKTACQKARAMKDLMWHVLYSAEEYILFYCIHLQCISLWGSFCNRCHTNFYSAKNHLLNKCCMGNTVVLKPLHRQLQDGLQWILLTSDKVVCVTKQHFIK